MSFHFGWRLHLAREYSKNLAAAGDVVIHTESRDMLVQGTMADIEKAVQMHKKEYGLPAEQAGVAYSTEEDCWPPEFKHRVTSGSDQSDPTWRERRSGSGGGFSSRSMRPI